MSEKTGLTWAERQALPGPRARFFFASGVPFFADAETGEAINGFPAADQKWKLVWPPKGRGHTYVKYVDRERKAARAARANHRDFPVVDLSPA